MNKISLSAKKIAQIGIAAIVLFSMLFSSLNVSRSFAATTSQQTPPVLIGINTLSYLTDSAVNSEIKSVDTWTGKSSALVEISLELSDANLSYNLPTELNALWNNGYAPLVDITGGSGSPSAYAIAAGEYDAHIQRWADTYKAWAVDGKFAFLAVLLAYVTIKGWPRLDSRLWTNMPSIRRPEQAGAESAITGTLWVIAFTALFALPIGFMSAVYLEEYAKPTSRFARFVEINIQNLAAVPSIVYGILGLAIFARALALGQTVITAGLTLALLVLPVVIVSTREALRAVPQNIRHGSLALGATLWQTTWRQTMPAAVPGMATGTILALSRAIGEAAPLLLLGAVTFISFNPTGPFSAYTTLPIQIYNWTKESREEFQILAAATIVLLLVILLAMNAVAILIRNRTQKRW